MQTLNLWRWRLTDPITGRRYTSHYLLTEHQALDADPGAERVEGTHVSREIDDPAPAPAAGAAHRPTPRYAPATDG